MLRGSGSEFRTKKGWNTAFFQAMFQPSIRSSLRELSIQSRQACELVNNSGLWWGRHISAANPLICLCRMILWCSFPHSTGMSVSKERASAGHQQSDNCNQDAENGVYPGPLEIALERSFDAGLLCLLRNVRLAIEPMRMRLPA